MTTKMPCHSAQDRAVPIPAVSTPAADIRTNTPTTTRCSQCGNGHGRPWPGRVAQDEHPSRAAGKPAPMTAPTMCTMACAGHLLHPFVGADDRHQHGAGEADGQQPPGRHQAPAGSGTTATDCRPARRPRPRTASRHRRVRTATARSLAGTDPSRPPGRSTQRIQPAAAQQRPAVRQPVMGPFSTTFRAGSRHPGKATSDHDGQSPPGVLVYRAPSSARTIALVTTSAPATTIW